MRLIGREAEKQALRDVLDSVRAGLSGTLVLRGEPGVGKSALLECTAESAAFGLERGQCAECGEAGAAVGLGLQLVARNRALRTLARLAATASP